jgi:hypothetical protein
MTKATRSRADAEFSQATKEKLAERAGYRCSFPGCRAVTIGPSAEGPDRSASTGMACHIRAAATGPSARRVSNASPQTLKQISNGIWMCYRHGKLIDADETTYTVEHLQTWKALAERRAELSHAAGAAVELWEDDHVHSLAKTRAALTSTDDLSRAVHMVLLEAGAFEVWETGAARAIRDLVIELARNAFDHGHATAVSIVVEARGVKLLNDGHEFGLAALRSHHKPGGGASALAELTNQHGAQVIATGRREGGENVVYLAAVRRPADLMAATPCHILLSPRGRLEDNAFDKTEDCDTVYLIGRGYMSYSDLYLLGLTVSEVRQRGKAVVVALPPLSTGVSQQMRKMLPDVKFIELPDAPLDPFA